MYVLLSAGGVGWGGTKRFRIHPPPNIGAAGAGESRKKENKES